MRDNRDVFDDGTAQQLSAEEIVAVRNTMSTKVVVPMDNINPRILFQQ